MSTLHELGEFMRRMGETESSIAYAVERAPRPTTLEQFDAVFRPADAREAADLSEFAP